MAEKKEWQELLDSTNKELKEIGFELQVFYDEDAYNLHIRNLKTDESEEYASGYFENELVALISDAECYVLHKTVLKEQHIYIVNCDAELLEEKEFNELTDEEIKEMYDAGSDYVDRYDNLHELAANWNSDEIFYPSNSYMRIIEE